MPSWQNRFLVGSPSRASPSQYDHGDNTYHSRPSVSESQASHGKQGEALYNVPIISSVAALELAPKHRPSTHGRSLSHPFSSISGTGRGANRRLPSNNNSLGEDTVDDRAVEVPSASTAPDVIVPVACGPQEWKDEPEDVIGGCATCGSKLRWPRGTLVFRCTVCLMINDLQPGKAHLVGSKSSNTAIPSTPEHGEKNSVYGK